MHRMTCFTCLRPDCECYCNLKKPFQSQPKFIVLIHPKEYRKAINTGKIVRNVVLNSELFVGDEFANHDRINKIINDPKNKCVILFPGNDSKDISSLPHPNQRTNLVFFILDGTWSMAKKMLKNSPNLRSLPQLSFEAQFESQYLIRKQPATNCLSTLETTHYIIDQFGQHPNREHDNLLEIFSTMVHRQIAYEQNPD